MAIVKFVKMHGLGNDYVVLDLFDKANAAAIEKIKDVPAFAKRVCSRYFGVGADGVLMAMPSRVADGRMRIINADGSEAEMCGNGIRCTAKFILDHNYAKKETIAIETLSGVKTIAADKEKNLYTVDMGEPLLLRKDIPMKGEGASQAIGEPLQLKNAKVNVTAVSMGNPHAVLFVDNADFGIEALGREIEHHASFPKKTNVEFVQVLGRGEIRLVVWERGVGETLACGTGSCASVVACVLNGKTGRKVKVHLKGGDLMVEWSENNHVFMTGPATAVFDGTIAVP